MEQPVCLSGGNGQRFRQAVVTVELVVERERTLAGCRSVADDVVAGHDQTLADEKTGADTGRWLDAHDSSRGLLGGIEDAHVVHRLGGKGEFLVFTQAGGDGPLTEAARQDRSPVSG